MMFENRFLPAVCALFAATLVGNALAQAPVADSQNRLLAKRAAEADAMRKLAETINGLQLTSETFVRDFVTESDQIQTAVDSIVKGVRFGQPVFHDDGVCEIPAEVTVQKVITDLKEIHTRHYKGDRVRATDFENIRQYVKKDIIQVIGMGAPRAELPPGLPQGYEEVITQVQVSPPPAVPPVPAIWKSIPPQARLMAKRAAELDAQRKLLERIKGLRLTSDTLVQDFVAQYDEIRTHASDIVVGAREVGVYYHDDEFIVEVTMEVPVESVITHLQELHTRHYQGRSVSATDISNLRQTTNSTVFEATGAGVPKPEFLQPVISSPPVISTPTEPAGQSQPAMPGWAVDRISAIGQGPDPEGGTPQGRMKAIRTAALDARRKLIEIVQGLNIDSTTSVRDFAAQFDEINAQLQGLLVGAVEEKTEYNPAEGVATVVVSVPGMQVWAVIHDQLEVTQRQP